LEQQLIQQATLCRIEERPDEAKALSVGSGLFAIRCSATPFA